MRAAFWTISGYRFDELATIDRVQTDPTLVDMNLEPIAVTL